VWLAWGPVAVVVPSAVWRTAVGAGVDLGWSQEHLDLEQIPGYGSFYVITLSVLTPRRVPDLRPGSALGERFPGWLPVIGERSVPVLAAVVPAVACYLAAVLWGPMLLAATWGYPSEGPQISGQGRTAP